MRHSDIWDLKKGDLLIYSKTGVVMPVLEITEDGKLKTIVNKQHVYRALGQLNKFCSRYNLIKKGDTVGQDIVFYSPYRNKMIEVPSGSIYLGEL